MSNPVFVRRVSWECRTCGRVVSGDEEPKTCSPRGGGCGAGGVTLAELTKIFGPVKWQKKVEPAPDVPSAPIPWESR